MSKRILIHGADPILTETPRKILSLDGFLVETVLNGAVSANLIQTKRPDLLIVCSSLSVDSQRRDVCAANALLPKVQSLVINSNFQEGTEINGADKVLRPFDGPERLWPSCGSY